MVWLFSSSLKKVCLSMRSARHRPLGQAKQRTGELDCHTLRTFAVWQRKFICTPQQYVEEFCAV